jgi:hypothetical protein
MMYVTPGHGWPVVNSARIASSSVSGHSREMTAGAAFHIVANAAFDA